MILLNNNICMTERVRGNVCFSSTFFLRNKPYPSHAMVPWTGSRAIAFDQNSEVSAEYSPRALRAFWAGCLQEQAILQTSEF